MKEADRSIATIAPTFLFPATIVVVACAKVWRRRWGSAVFSGSHLSDGGDAPGINCNCSWYNERATKIVHGVLWHEKGRRQNLSSTQLGRESERINSMCDCLAISALESVKIRGFLYRQRWRAVDCCSSEGSSSRKYYPPARIRVPYYKTAISTINAQEFVQNTDLLLVHRLDIPVGAV